MPVPSKYLLILFIIVFVFVIFEGKIKVVVVVVDDFQRPWFSLICLLVYFTVRALGLSTGLII